MMDALEVAREILNLPAILLADFLALDAAARAYPFLWTQSPPRERKTNRPLPNGSWPITVFTRSANLSKPHRISVGSAASQMRHACAPSSVRRLGRPITLPPPIPPAMHVDDPRRIPAPLPDCSRE